MIKNLISKFVSFLKNRIVGQKTYEQKIIVTSDVNTTINNNNNH